MSDEDDFTSPQDVAENISDGRPPPPFAGLDRYFDEPEPSGDGRVGGLLGWAAKASKAQRGGLVDFAAWCAQAPDAERRVILLLMEQYAGRVPMGAVADVAAAASVSRQTVFNAVRRFVSYFPGAISEARRSKG
jgi:hypothetical protein